VSHHNSHTTETDRTPSQYDLYLTAIPLAVGMGIAGGTLLAVPLFVGTAVGATLAAGVVGYSLYEVTQDDSTTTEPRPPLGTETDDEKRT